MYDPYGKAWKDKMKRILMIFVALSASAARADWEESDARPGFLRPGGIVVFMNMRAPLSLVTLTPDQIPAGAVDAGAVFCRSCQHGLSVPVTPPSGTSRGTSVSGAAGNGGFERALAGLKIKRPEIRGIYDVKVDYQKISILGIYRRQCTEITARGFK